jgi:hypothetical protein
VPRFVLRDTDMNDLGSVTFSTPQWGLGDVFTTGDDRKLQIVDVLELLSRKPSTCGSEAFG